MSVPLKPTITRCALAEVADKDNAPGWITRVRAALAGQGHEVRLGWDCSIEARIPGTLPWQPILLPGGGTRFTDEATARAVLEMLTKP